MPPQGLTNDEDNQQKLAQDNSTPFSAPDDAADTTDDTHPQADTNVDSQEQYDEGISGATEANDPGDRGVLGYSRRPINADDDDESDDEDDREEE